MCAGVVNASLSHLNMIASCGLLRLRVREHAAAHVGVWLPGHVRQWRRGPPLDAILPQHLLDARLDTIDTLQILQSM